MPYLSNRSVDPLQWFTEDNLDEVGDLILEVEFYDEYDSTSIIANDGQKIDV